MALESRTETTYYYKCDYPGCLGLTGRYPSPGMAMAEGKRLGWKFPAFTAESYCMGPHKKED